MNYHTIYELVFIESRIIIPLVSLVVAVAAGVFFIRYSGFYKPLLFRNIKQIVTLSNLWMKFFGFMWTLFSSIMLIVILVGIGIRIKYRSDINKMILENEVNTVEGNIIDYYSDENYGEYLESFGVENEYFELQANRSAVINDSLTYRISYIRDKNENIVLKIEESRNN